MKSEVCYNCEKITNEYNGLQKCLKFRQTDEIAKSKRKIAAGSALSRDLSTETVDRIFLDIARFLKHDPKESAKLRR